MAEFLNLCEKEPERGLEAVRTIMSDKPHLASPFLKFCMAMAHMQLGVKRLTTVEPGNVEPALPGSRAYRRMAVTTQPYHELLLRH